MANYESEEVCYAKLFLLTLFPATLLPIVDAYTELTREETLEDRKTKIIQAISVRVRQFMVSDEEFVICKIPTTMFCYCFFCFNPGECKFICRFAGAPWLTVSMDPTIFGEALGNKKWPPHADFYLPVIDDLQEIYTWLKLDKFIEKWEDCFDYFEKNGA